jgi:hypothetical protein
VANWFASKGLPVKDVMPMYYRPTIRRTTNRPSRDFIFVYVGKETDSTALRMLLETGLPVTMFGSKSVGWVMKSLHLERYPRARLLGYITDRELSDQYSNARFCAFPFTEEPFGLVPLESMACGTPVLTYGQQGPAESVVDGRTGWLVNSREEFVRRAVEQWNAGAPSSLMVERCLERARLYHLDTIRSAWDNLIETAYERFGEEISRFRPPSWTPPTPAIGVGELAYYQAVRPPVGPAERVPGLEPVPYPDLPIVEPLGEFPPILLKPPSVSSRSGAFLPVRDSDENALGTEVDLTKVPDRYVFRPRSPPGVDDLRSPPGSRRSTEQDTASTV